MVDKIIRLYDKENDTTLEICTVKKSIDITINFHDYFLSVEMSKEDTIEIANQLLELSKSL